MSNLPTLNLVGAGRVAQTLSNLWHTQGRFAIQDVLTTSLNSAQAACRVIGAGHAVQSMRAMRTADVWMLAVQDAQLAHCALALAAAAPAVPSIVFHCSGAQGASTLAQLAALGWRVASAH